MDNLFPISYLAEGDIMSASEVKAIQDNLVVYFTTDPG